MQARKDSTSSSSTPNLVEQLLQYVVEGKQEEAEALLKQDPSLMVRGTGCRLFWSYIR
jgi:hypothetical protein